MNHLFELDFNKAFIANKQNNQISVELLLIYSSLTKASFFLPSNSNSSKSFFKNY